MAQRKLPSTSARIFKKKPSYVSRLISAGLLTLSLLVVLVGIGTAVYLEDARAPAPQQQAAAESLAAAPAVPTSHPQTAAEAPSLPAVPPPLRDPPTAAATPPSVPVSAPPTVAPVAPVAPPAAPAAAETAPLPAAATVETAPPAAEPTSAPETATSLALIEPQAGEPAEPAPDASPAAPPDATPLQPAAPTEAETAAPPANAGAEPPPVYWVEYGVYVRRTYAQRLKGKLAEQGLESVVVWTRTPAGRPLLRVRSDRVTHAVAVAAAQTAHRALKIRPLIHRDHRAAPNAAGLAVAAAAPRGYWVQYGAFAHRHNAQRLDHELTRHGLHAKIYIRRGKSGKPLYLVRSSGLPDHASAAQLVQRYKQMATADVLIGHSRGFHGRHESAGSRHAPEPDERQRPALQRTG